MRHRKTLAKLGRTSTHRKAMFRNMVTSLLREERVETTLPKAKEARRIAERMITHAKKGSLHARRQAARTVRDQGVLQKLFDELGPRFAERPGGYTRILKTGFRRGDNAAMSILELLPEEGAPAIEEATAEAKKAKGKKTTEEKAEKKTTKKTNKKVAAKKSTKKDAAKKTAKKSSAKKAAKKPAKKKVAAKK